MKKQGKTDQDKSRGLDLAVPPVRRIPAQAVVLSLVALAVPLGARLLPGHVPGEQEFLVWLLALVPAFLFSYYRGWTGAATGIAAAMAAFSLACAVSVGLGGDLTLDARAPEMLAILLFVSVGAGWVTEKMHRDRARITELALTDDLTGLPNRRHLDLFLRSQFAAAMRGRNVSLVLFDLDRFKPYNDRFGHRAGDQALAAVGEVIRRVTRQMDLASRLGGEEFLAVLTDSVPHQAAVYAERVRQEVAKLQLEEPITLSAGIAHVTRDMQTPEDAIDAADRALYQAKQEGRDRIVILEEAPAN